MQGVLLTGGMQGHSIDSSTGYGVSTTDQTLFYHLHYDSWMTLPSFPYHTAAHQMVTFDGKPTIIDGFLYARGEDFRAGEYLNRNYLQTFQVSGSVWDTSMPFFYKRSQFAAVSIDMH